MQSGEETSARQYVFSTKSPCPQLTVAKYDVEVDLPQSLEKYEHSGVEMSDIMGNLVFIAVL